jgi:tetratricopeptide (TPR) repeat protein
VSLAEDPTIVPALRVRRSEPSAEPTTAPDRSEPPDVGPAPPGSVIGRYIVLSELGAGAMGRVYAAYDPRLDRKVALKLLRGPGADGGTARGTARLFAEAKALARLSHPNVVGVHDVEMLGSQVAIAMELVDGTTLRQWLAAPRQWREVLAMMLDAGEGLAAAHRAGIVHRDFKPDNVMIASDGRPRVVDFGLARAVEVTSELDAGDSATTGAAVLVTQGIAGTPAYMAPELFAGAPADARSDQFSYCVALFEALYGRRPFAGNSPVSVLNAALAGEIVVAEGDIGVPGWLHRLVVRGLSAEASRRYPDLDALLREARRDPGRRTRRIALGVVGASAFVGVPVATWMLARADDPCAEVGRTIADDWNDERRAAIDTGLRATGVPWAARAATQATERLDAFAEDLAAMAEASCVATHVRHEQSEAMLDRRTACLAARRRELVAVSSALASADDAVAQQSVRILDTLGPVDACADLDRLAMDLPLPEDPRTAAAVADVRQELARIEVLTRAGKFVDAGTAVDAAVATAESLGYPPVLAEARHAQGYLQDKLGDAATAEVTLCDVAIVAQRIRHDTLAARALADAVFVIGSQLARTDDALIWARHADAAAERLGDPLAIAKAATVRGAVLQVAGKLGEAESALRQGLELRVAALGELHLDVSLSLANLAVVLEGQGRDEEAVTLYERARAIDETLLGPQHPRVAGALNNAVTSLLELGRVDEALASAQRAEAIFRASLPADHPHTAAALGSVASAMHAKGDTLAAKIAAAQQLEMNVRRLGAAHPDVALAHHNLGTLEYELGDHTAAGRHFALAIAGYEAIDPEHPELAGSLSAAGEVEHRLGRHREARAYFERAIAILRDAGLEGRVELPIAQRSLARVCLALGDLPAARASVERALALFAAQPRWADRLAPTHWLDATIRRAAHDMPGAIAAAERALATCSEDCDAWRDELATWRREG